MLKQFEQYLTDKDWHEVQAGIEVKLVAKDDGNETFILARSRNRQEKEKAIHERFIERMEAALHKLKSSIDSGRLKDITDAYRRLGRLQQRYWRAASAFEIQLHQFKIPSAKNA
jgi:hypothetical protein